jgi:DNA-binding IclR family transcriptional regulator
LKFLLAKYVFIYKMIIEIEDLSMSKEAKSKYRVPALEKGLDILETLALSQTPLSLTELARKQGRSSSELFRMLTVLESRGYINKREASGNYALSLKLYELAHLHPPVMNLLEAAAQPMGNVTNVLRESCHLSVLRRGKLAVLKEVLSPTRVRLSVPVGGRFSLVDTVSGRLLLAYLPDRELTAFLANSEEHATLNKSGQAAFMAKLADIRETGVSTAVSETHLGVSDAAVLVGNPHVGLCAALAVASLKASSDPDHFQQIIAQLKQCAKTITQAMGLEKDIGRRKREERKRKNDQDDLL